MRKISVEKDANRVVLYVRGRLSGSLVSELENCWKRMFSSDIRNPIKLDLGEVTFVDKGGKALLSEMVANGVQLQANGPIMTPVAERIISDTLEI